MDLRKRYLTENACYKAGDKIEVDGLMLHSTGANNPKLSRYVDAPELGEISPNHWNTDEPGGRKVCVHGFIGYDKEKDIATYQTLPWNHRGWGGGGSSNNTHIHVEICEADLDDEVYFDKVYQEAVEVFAYLCEKFKLNPMNDVTTHSEGHDDGIASNHADVMHWFPKHGKDMDDFRKAVKAEMAGNKIEKPVTNPSTPTVAPKPAPVAKSIATLAQEVIDGKHGAGDARKKSLGTKFDAVQAKVNELLGDKSTPKPKAKSVDQLAREVIDGKHGAGEARAKSLGSQYAAVQKRVNQMVNDDVKPAVKPKVKPAAKPKVKSIAQLVDEVNRGVHGSGRERMLSLGNRYAEVQKEVNRRSR